MTDRITYTLLDPTGNITLLVETPILPADQPVLARRLMEMEPAAEQVGFVKRTDEGICLRMAGGEFCGNATMSAAVLFAAKKRLRSCEVLVPVSGAPEPVPVRVEAAGEGVWDGTVSMPRPLSLAREHFPDGSVHPVVRFPGIAHVILEEKITQNEAERQAPIWCDFLKADGLGLMFLDRNRKTLKPLVWVPDAGTMFWESSCASGTTAVGAWLARESGGALALPLKQPGGTLEISVDADGALRLTGRVQIIKRATVDIT